MSKVGVAVGTALALVGVGLVLSLNDKAALTGSGLASGMTRNPDPSWKPGSTGLTQAQISTGLGFTGYYETVTPGSGTRPDYLTQTEQANLSNDGTTGVGAVWNLYYALLPNKANVIAYISSVADNSGGNDGCQASDTSLALTSAAMDSWSATRWITRTLPFSLYISKTGSP